MPLTSISKVYKNFPTFFADKVTEHVRKRTNSYRQEVADLIVDNEVVEVCSQKPPPTPGSRAVTAHARPPSRAAEGRSLTTKRSDTPLGVVSDAESDSDSPRLVFTSPGGGTPAPPALQAPSPSKPPADGGYIASTFNYLTKPRWPKCHTSPRTCTSLDNVDLWESDEESDMSQGYDKINGVSINPSKTIDLSELHSSVRRSRSPVACKRNKTDKVKVSEQREPRLEKGSREQPVKPAVKAPRKANISLLPDLPRSCTEPSKRESQRDLNQLQTSVDGSMAAIMKQANSQIRVRRSASQRQSPKPMKTINNNNSSAMRRSLIGGKGRQEVTPSPTRIPATHVTASQVGSTYTGTTRVGTTYSAFHPQAPPIGPVHVPTPPTTKKLSKPLPDYARERMCRNNRSPEPTLEIDPKDSPNTRKVKFQNYVTVREGEQSKTEDLRMSNNSAQQYKQMYLGGGASAKSPPKTPPPPAYNPANYEDSEDSMDQSTWRMGMVC